MSSNETALTAGTAGLAEWLEGKGIPFERDAALSGLTYFRTGGLARLLVRPAAAQQLAAAVQECRRRGETHRVVGATSNCLFLNADYPVLILTTGLNRLRIDAAAGEVEAQTGVMLPALAKKCSAAGLTGFEGLCGIPGTVGGGVVMNAGAYGNEIADGLREADVLMPDGQVRVMTRDELGFGFRLSDLQAHPERVVLAARFTARRGDPEAIRRKLDHCARDRRTYQEQRWPNLGSLFATFDIYGEIRRSHPAYAVVIALNRIHGRIFRPDHNRFINRLTAWVFHFPYRRRPYSDKTLNCLINTGDNYAEVLDYIGRMQEICRGLRLENIIVRPRSEEDA